MWPDSDTVKGISLILFIMESLGKSAMTEAQIGVVVQCPGCRDTQATVFHMQWIALLYKLSVLLLRSLPPTPSCICTHCTCIVFIDIKESRRDLCLRLRSKYKKILQFRPGGAVRMESKANEGFYFKFFIRADRRRSAGS